MPTFTKNKVTPAKTLAVSALLTALSVALGAMTLFRMVLRFHPTVFRRPLDWK